MLPNSTGTHQTKQHYCYDIPFLESLQLLLRKKEVQKQVYSLLLNVCTYVRL